MSSQTDIQDSKLQTPNTNSKHLNRLKIIVGVLSVGGITLFSYFIYSVGVTEIIEGISRFGFGGFAVILLIYFLRICVRGWGWTLSVYEPYKLELKDTIPAVIIGEALSSIIPLGIVISGTSKAVAVRHKVPLVVGLSSIATENLFYSFITGLFIACGGFALLHESQLSDGMTVTIDFLLVAILVLIFSGILMIIRQWHFASEICEKLYQKGFATGILEHGRMQVRLFENLIYGFYRRYPQRFIPIIFVQVIFHLLGILEAYFILGKVGETLPSLFTAFLLESVSRMISIVFKVVPFLVGVDEAGSQFITETMAIGAGIGITIAIIRKGRVLFWAIIGLLLIIKRGISFKEITKLKQN